MSKFEQLKIDSVAWLGKTKDELTIKISIDGMDNGMDGFLGFDFWVINGNWRGTLYKDINTNELSIVDEQGTLHKQIFINQIEEDEIPY